MNKFYLISVWILSAVLMLFGVSCRHETSPDLQKADELMNEFPDSALSILDNLDTTMLTSQRDRAVYSLLLTEAHQQLDYGTNDSIIDSAIKYFDVHEPMSDYALRSHYYKAIILQNIVGKPREALQEYLWTLQISRKIGDRFRAGASCLRIAEIFIDNGMPNEAIRYSKDAYGNLKGTHRKPHIAYSGFLLGEAYNARQMPDSALLVLNSVEDDVKKYCHEEVYDNLKIEMIISTFLKKDYEKVIDMCRSDSTMMLKPYHVLYCGLALAKKGNLDEADTLLEQMPSVPGVEAIQIEVLRNIISQCRHFDEGYQTAGDAVLNYNLKKYADRDNLALPEIYMSFMDQKMRADEESIRNRTNIIWLIVTCSVLLCAVLTIIFVGRRNGLKRKLSDQIEFIESLKQSSKSDKALLEATAGRLEELETKLQEQEDTFKATCGFDDEKEPVKENVTTIENRESTRSDIAEFILSKYSLLNDICSLDVDYNKLIKQFGRSKSLRELKNLMKNLSSDSEIFREIAGIIDQKYDGIFTRFEQDFSDLDFRMKKLFLYICMDLSPKFIMQLIGYDDIGKVYSLKRKLKALIKARDVRNCDRYLEMMSR